MQHTLKIVQIKVYQKSNATQKGVVGNELVHAGSHARPQAVDRGMPSQEGSTE